jgi:hypothetical protein
MGKRDVVSVATGNCAAKWYRRTACFYKIPREQWDVETQTFDDVELCHRHSRGTIIRYRQPSIDEDLGSDGDFHRSCSMEEWYRHCQATGYFGWEWLR